MKRTLVTPAGVITRIDYPLFNLFAIILIIEATNIVTMPVIFWCCLIAKFLPSSYAPCSFAVRIQIRDTYTSADCLRAQLKTGGPSTSR